VDFKFIAIDVETANSARKSICQIGLVFFENGEITRNYVSLVNQKRFNPTNVSIHGITPEMVKSAPDWSKVWGEIRPQLDGAFVVSHTLFDQQCLVEACSHIGAADDDCDLTKWIDSCKVSRLAWPKLPNHKLKTVANHLGVTFQHHDALEDARAAGEIFWAVMKTGKLELTFMNGAKVQQRESKFAKRVEPASAVSTSRAAVLAPAPVEVQSTHDSPTKSFDTPSHSEMPVAPQFSLPQARLGFWSFLKHLFNR
jgi:DNA polymerase-3 subunit epsilon